MTKLTIKDEGDVRRMRLSNPERHNAFDDGLVTDLHDVPGRGEWMSARWCWLPKVPRSCGRDLAWMRRMAASRDKNIADMGLSAMLLAVRSQPVIARVRGPRTEVVLVWWPHVIWPTPCLPPDLPSRKFVWSHSCGDRAFLLGRWDGPFAQWASRVPASTPPSFGLEFVHSVVDEDGLDLAINATIDAFAARAAAFGLEALLQQLPGHSDPARPTAEELQTVGLCRRRGGIRRSLNACYHGPSS